MFVQPNPGVVTQSANGRRRMYLEARPNASAVFDSGSEKTINWAIPLPKIKLRAERFR